MAKTERKKSVRYAIMLLFSYRIGKRTSSPVTREIRILHYQKYTRDNAIKKAESTGQSSEHDFVNDQGQKVYYRFDRIVDVLELGIETDENEVWYDVFPAAGNQVKSKPFQQWIQRKVSSNHAGGRTDRKTYGRV